jgi:hypothetical protein
VAVPVISFHKSSRATVPNADRINRARLRQGINDGLLLRHIDSYRHDPLAGAREAVGGLLGRVLLDVGHGNVGAGFRECGRDTKADAGSGTGDDGGSAGDVHSASLSTGFAAGLARHERRRNSSPLPQRLLPPDHDDHVPVRDRAAGAGGQSWPKAD